MLNKITPLQKEHSTENPLRRVLRVANWPFFHPNRFAVFPLLITLESGDFPVGIATKSPTFTCDAQLGAVLM